MAFVLLVFRSLFDLLWRTGGAFEELAEMLDAIQPARRLHMEPIQNRRHVGRNRAAFTGSNFASSPIEQPQIIVQRNHQPRCLRRPTNRLGPSWLLGDRRQPTVLRFCFGLSVATLRDAGVNRRKCRGFRRLRDRRSHRIEVDVSRASQDRRLVKKRDALETAFPKPALAAILDVRTPGDRLG